jgi:hypothetical protein
MSARGRDGRVMLSISLATGPLWAMKHLLRAEAAEITLAVQTLRNTIIIAVFLGGGSLTTAVGILGSLNAERALVLTLPELQRLLIASVLFFAFLNFMLVVRAANHIGYFVGTAAGRVQGVSEAALAAARRGSVGASALGPPQEQRLTWKAALDTFAAEEAAAVAEAAAAAEEEAEAARAEG